MLPNTKFQQLAAEPPVSKVDEDAATETSAADDAAKPSMPAPEIEQLEVNVDSEAEQAEIVPHATEEPEIPEPVTGVVTNCSSLYLREEPDPNGGIITTLPALTEVVVDLEASTEAFYQVCTAAGAQGFCMKKYIAIRR